MGRYAASTTVPSEKSRLEIEGTLRRYGASAFGYGWGGAAAVIMFEVEHRRVRFSVPLPDRAADEFCLTPTNRRRTQQAADEAYEQAIRQRWRALVLVIKAKLEAVDAGITTLEQEFLAHVILPSGSTVGEWLAPQLAIAYERDDMPALLPGVS